MVTFTAAYALSMVAAPESLQPTRFPEPQVGTVKATVTIVDSASSNGATEAPRGTTSSTSGTTGCYAEPVTLNTPTGIAGCERWGIGIASHYGPGAGVAMNFCTWKLRHEQGCGWVSVRSLQSGITVTVPVIDFCDCYTTTQDERIIDLQWGVLDSLGLNPSQGLYKVEVWPVN